MAARQSCELPFGPFFSILLAAGHSRMTMMPRATATVIFSQSGMDAREAGCSFRQNQNKPTLPEISNNRSVVAGECAKQLQHGNEQVVDTQVQRNGGVDVVGFTTVDNAAGIEEDQPAHQHDDRCRQRQ